MGELKLMKGNEALAEAAIRAGVDAYFGYPITPQSEVIEYLMTERPEERTGMVVLQAESEVAAINMLYGAAGSGNGGGTSSRRCRNWKGSFPGPPPLFPRSSASRP